MGSVLKIDLGGGYHGYGRILEKASYAFYDIRTTDELQISEIISHRILFIVAVYNYAVNSGRWLKIGKPINLESNLLVLPNKYIQDVINPKEFSIYEPNSGVISSAKKEDCIGLEVAAVWEAEHVEERLRNYFDGVSNRSMEADKKLFLEEK